MRTEAGSSLVFLFNFSDLIITVMFTSRWRELFSSSTNPSWKNAQSTSTNYFQLRWDHRCVCTSLQLKKTL